MPDDSRQSRRVFKAALLLLSLLVASMLLARHLSFDRPAGEIRLSSEPGGEPDPSKTSLLFMAITPPAPTVKHPAIVKKQPGNSPEPPPVTVNQRENTEQTGSRFIKIAFNGEILHQRESHWSCARDQGTGLLWEVKLFNAGVSDAEHTYSWYAPGQNSPGRENGGQCFGTGCDTDAYVKEMNRLKLCGSSRWRLPRFIELEGLIDRNYHGPTINQEIFPHTQSAVYWTATELENNPDMVMQVNFFNGISTAVPKNLSYALRLVSP